MIQIVDLQRPCRLLKPEIDTAIQDAPGSSRFIREIYQIRDVINHAS